MLIIQKYGGATLENPEKIKAVARQISDLKNQGQQVVVIVSAMGQTTNQLLNLSQQVSKNPLLRELDMLLSVGERISMSLVSMALNDLNHHAISLTGSQAGIMTDESHVNAMITDVKAHRVIEALSENKIVIIAGFQGVNPINKEITTLGRGGSDTSAVAIAAFLKADRCEILKDVSGIFSADPKLITTAKLISKLNYSILLEMTYWGAKVLHYRSVELAFANKVNLFIGLAHTKISDNNINLKNGTLINEDTMFETTRPISVNSHKNIFQILIKNKSQIESIEALNENFKRNQIGTPQILLGITNNNETSLFVTAPDEIMVLIKDFCLKNTDYKIENENLCSVSLTCTGSSLNEVLIQCQKKLSEEKIQTKYFIQSAMSLNFFIDQSQKNQAVQSLHSLINLT